MAEADSVNGKRHTDVWPGKPWGPVDV